MAEKSSNVFPRKGRMVNSLIQKNSEYKQATIEQGCLVHVGTNPNNIHTRWSNGTSFRFKHKAQERTTSNQFPPFPLGSQAGKDLCSEFLSFLPNALVANLSPMGKVPITSYREHQFPKQSTLRAAQPEKLQQSCLDSHIHNINLVLQSPSLYLA